MKRFLPAALTLTLALYLLIPPVFTEPQFVDEQFYTWGGSYVWDHLARLDFQAYRAPGAGAIPDPGWNPYDWWFASSPQGFRLLYAGVMNAAKVSPPSRAFVWKDRDQPQPAADIPRDTLLFLRLFSVVCASLGFSALALRFGWSGLAGFIVYARLPSNFFGVWQELLWAPSHVMAEGPLILALGLCLLSYRSRWFGPACAFTASCKLTALGAWPLLLLPGASGRGWRSWAIGLASTVGLWVLFNPASWFAGGPLYLLTEIMFRTNEQLQMSSTDPGPWGYYLSKWYLTAPAYGLAVGYSAALQALLRRTDIGSRLWQRVRRSTPVTDTP